MPLTSKKRRFADAKLAGSSNKDAAIEAGYSAATASAAGARLVKDRDVVSYMSKAKTAPEKPGSSQAMQSEHPSVPTRNNLELLEAIGRGEIEATALQVRALIAAVQYTHTKKGDGGKKDEEAEKAKKAGAGKFAPAAPPKLVAAGGKKV